VNVINDEIYTVEIYT